MSGSRARIERGKGRNITMRTQGDQWVRNTRSDDPGGIKLGDRSQEESPEKTRYDFRAHGFGKRGTIAPFDVIIVNIDVGSYLCMSHEKALSKAEKEKKEKYLQTCFNHMNHVITLV